MKKQRMWVAVVLLLTLAWGVFSVRWYTCGVKGFCGQPATVPEQKEPMPEKTQERPIVPDTSDPVYDVKG